MKLEIISKEQNSLMKRREVAFRVEHNQTGGTPTRAEIREQLASLLKTKPELIYVKNMETKRGTMVAVGEANVYETDEQAKFVEPKHIIARNTAKEEVEESEAAEEATEEEGEEEE